MIDLSKTPIEYGDNKEVLKIVNNFHDAQEKYLRTFGYNSLDRVIMPNPYDTGLSGYQEAKKELLSAIKNKNPFEQFTEEEWEKLIF